MNYVMSIDLGGTNLRIGIVDEQLNIIDVKREPTTKNDEKGLSNKFRNGIMNFWGSPFFARAAIYLSDSGLHLLSFLQAFLNFPEYFPNPCLQSLFQGLQDFF